MERQPRSKLKQVIGVILLLAGLFALVTPLTPGSGLIFVGLELIGIRLLFIEKIKETYKNRGTMLSGFKQFILRGNVVDLAIGVLIGAAFNSVVSALVKDIFTPLIAAIFKQPDFSNLFFTINESKVLYGDFLNALISFIIVALVVYFFVVIPMNSLSSRFRSGQPAEATTKACPECLSNIPKDARRCAYCTAQLAGDIKK